MTSNFRAVAAAVTLAVAAPIVARPAAAQDTGPPGGYVPQRVYDPGRRAFTDFEAMTADLARADVVLLGEQHDDPDTHRLELAVLEALGRRGASVILSLEMFERDTQGALDAYLAGGSAEAEFLGRARPWPRYATDYRPLVELARSRHWPVVAANVPRRIAAAVAKDGQPSVDELPPSDRALVAADLRCPYDAYFDRFAEQMGEHASSDPKDGAATRRYYWAQCVKDETMAESVAAASARQPRGAVVVHVTGAFHSEFGRGTAERVRRRMPGRRVVAVSMRPVDDLDAVLPAEEDVTRADYFVYTLKK